MVDILVYGASGYTGQLIATRARQAGIDLVLAGRSATSVAEVAEDEETRVFTLDDPGEVRRGLADVQCVINAAGPFDRTVGPMLDACLKVGAHYLDVSGELQAFRVAERRDSDAQKAGVMAMPGAGWDVVASDSVAWVTAKRVASPKVLRIALRHGEHHVRSHGSARTLNLLLQQDNLWRQDGALTSMKGAPPREFDFGSGPTTFYPFPMADPISTWRSTRIDNIEVYGAGSLAAASPVPEADIVQTPRGPSEEALPLIRAMVLAEVEGEGGTVARTLLETIGGHEFTALATLDIAQRCLRSDFKPGYQSPASAYGDALLESVPGSTLTELP